MFSRNASFQTAILFLDRLLRGTISVYDVFILGICNSSQITKPHSKRQNIGANMPHSRSHAVSCNASFARCVSVKQASVRVRCRCRPLFPACFR